MAEETFGVKKKKLKPLPKVIKEFMYHTKEPLIFKNILSWDILKWTMDDWFKYLEDIKLDFRLGKKGCTKVPQWENSCETVSSSIREALKNSGKSSDLWMYFDYKHMNQCFKNRPELLESLSWGDFGLGDKDGKDSTIWIGTEGAYTPCHMDSYGYNIVAQVHGRKLWVLFPPSSASVLRPTRVPYEESSIYSKIHFACGRNILNDIGEARVVELSPGDVLVVPKHWWHYVENLSAAISINMWIPRKSDDASRLEEAVVRFSVATIMKGIDVDTSCEAESLLNPNEADLPDETIDLRQISWCVERQMSKGTDEEEEGINTLADVDLSFVSPVARVSPHELRKLLLDKCGCEAEIDTPGETPNPRPLGVEDIINAFCHPSVVSQISKLLLATRRQ